MSAGASKYRDQFSVRECIIALFVIGCAFGVIRYLQSMRGPTSNGMSVTHWLKLPYNSTNDTPDNAEFVAEVAAFGPEGIPVFLDALDWVTNAAQPFDWFGWKKRSIPGPWGIAPLPARHREERLWMAMFVLCREYPDQANPYITNLLTTSYRYSAIRSMGHMGDRHFSFLTNLVFTGHRSDARPAMWSLPRYQPRSVSVLLEYLEGKGRTHHQLERGAMYALNWVGGEDERVLPALLQRLQSTNIQLRADACRVLKLRTNELAQIRPAIIRSLHDMTNVTQVWRSPLRYLHDFDIPASDGVPVLIDYLKHWLPIERHEVFPTNICQIANYLSGYGSAASPAVPLLEDGIMNELRSVSRHTTSVKRRADSSLRMIEEHIKLMTR